MALNSRSRERLEQCHPDLQRLIKEVSRRTPIYVICGYRNKEDQNDAYRLGNTKLKYPMSKHNKKPSLAVDIVPNPLSWRDIESFRVMVNVAKEVARELNIDVRFGSDFKSIVDWPHIELIS